MNTFDIFSYSENLVSTVHFPLHSEESLIFGSGDTSKKNVNFALTSFPQNSFSPTLRLNENVNLPLHATANWASSKLRSEESLNLSSNINQQLNPKITSSVKVKSC